MTPSERERLVLLIEEAAEVQQIACKILRHGYESYHPDDLEKTTNRRLLEDELGHLDFAVQFMTDNEDLDENQLMVSRIKKSETIQKYLHYNQV